MIPTLSDTPASRELGAVEKLSRGNGNRYKGWSSYRQYFTTDFEAYVEKVGMTKTEALRSSKRYLEEHAKEVVSGLLYQNNSRAYRKVRRKLKDRFESGFNATKLLQSKLAKFSKNS